MADPRPALEQISDGLAGLILAAAGMETLADYPDACALAAGTADLFSDLAYAMTRIGDHLEGVPVMRKEFPEQFRYASRMADEVADDTAQLCARYQVTG